MSKQIHLLLSCLTIFCTLFTSCNRKQPSETNIDYSLPDTLVVGTLYSPTSYFLYKGDLMGYHYDLISQFAKDKNIPIKFKVMRNMGALLSLLDSAKIDIIAYNVPATAEYKDKMRHCGFENITTQVLVQPIYPNVAPISDVTQLVGKEIYVEKNSKYESRLKNLNNELGGGIRIKPIGKDTLMAEDLIEMVAEGRIPLTIVDSDIAQLDHTYYPNINVSLKVSFPQKSSWAVGKNNQQLAEIIDKWASEKNVIQIEKTLFRHYFETSKINRRKIIDLKKLRYGHISEYDNLFKAYAKTIDWDWKLLAAQGYVESRFDPNATSWAGAKGLMQLMPGTARNYGLSPEEITNPEKNIEAATKSIRDLNKSLKKYVPDDAERIKFILAAYNSGIAHIYDAIALAKKYGKNPQIWHGNVSEALLMKSNPEFYNDNVCKYGYFRGKQTVSYVNEVSQTYDIFCQAIK